MSEPIDPSALRWVEAGVSGLARRRDWDSVELVALPELADDELAEFRFGALADGTLVPDGAAVERSVLERLDRRLRDVLGGAYEAIAARQTRLDWSVAARSLRIEEVVLPGVGAAEIVVALPPGGERSVVVDGHDEEASAGVLRRAVEQLVELGAGRHATFVVRARRTVGDRFAVSVDPL